LAEFAEGLHLVEKAIPGDDSEAVFDGGSELYAAEAVEVEIFAETEIVADAGGSLAGDLSNQREEPVGGCAECGCAVAVIAGAGVFEVVEPFRNGFAPDFSGRGAWQIRFRPKNPAAQALKLREFRVGMAAAA
jgi:hypothetical protein